MRRLAILRGCWIRVKRYCADSRLRPSGALVHCTPMRIGLAGRGSALLLFTILPPDTLGWIDEYRDRFKELMG